MPSCPTDQHHPPTKTGKLLVISGPSGSGKSTLCRRAVKQTGARLSISATTRPPGKNEVNAKEYFFLTEKEFLARIDAGEFLEYAQVFGHYYGTPAPAVEKMLDQGLTVVLEIDVQGAAQVFDRFPDALGILVLPPNEQEVKRRLQSRGREEQDVIDTRLAKAQWEIAQAQDSGRYAHTIVNDNLDQATEELVKLIE